MSASAPLSQLHASRLRAAARELQGLLEQVRAIALEGRNASGAEPTYTPLAPERGVPLAAALDELAEQAARVAALAGTPEPVKRPGEAATRVAVSARLARLEETLKDLHPDLLQEKYGNLPPAVAAELGELCAGMAGLLIQARAALNRA